MEYNYTAIILKKRKIGETDRLYTFYTLEAGKLQSIGRGIRKPKAKLAGHLETLSQSDVIVARRHGLGNIASAITEQYFLNIKTDETMLARVFQTIAYFEQLVDFEERDEELFGLLRAYLVVIDGLEGEAKYEKARIITQGFLFRLLSHLGYHLEMRVCAVSGDPLSSSNRYYFSPDIGGVIDARYTNRAKKAVAINENVIKLIRIFFQNRLSSMTRLCVSHEDLVCVERVSQSFLRWIEH
ncbi:MAG: DNA repair protein RecO [Candidatus Moranbacteria bacterium]|nr:DNA repair protein RecO [Candidatus Moranbacteria bacterium]